MFSHRLVPAVRLAGRSFSRDVSPWGYWERWGPPRSYRYRRCDPMTFPTFGPLSPMNRLLLYNLNRIRDTLDSFWFDGWHETELKTASRPKTDQKAKESSFGQEISESGEVRSDVFTVSLNVGDAFKPDEITVKVAGRYLEIEGKHEERGENGHYVNRSFAHSYVLPPDVDEENLSSRLTAEGILNVEAPRLAVADVKQERHIPVQHDAGGADSVPTGDTEASAGGTTQEDSTVDGESEKK